MINQFRDGGMAFALKQGLAGIPIPSEQPIVSLVRGLNPNRESLGDYLADPGGRPYGRRLVSSTDLYEVLLMNWKGFVSCSPHDHGDSEGWVFVIEGEAENTSYSCDDSNNLNVIDVKTVKQGDFFYAANSIVHKMISITPTLLTLHIYTPPIKGMRVYDIFKCFGCVVSDDCGAWWPDEQRQLLEKFRITSESGRA